MVWERLENETDVAFAAFACYRDMGAARSCAKVGQKLGKSKALIERWSKAHQWVDRVLAFDDDQDRITREKLARGVTEMRKKHTDIASAMLIKAAKGLQSLPTSELSARDVIAMVDTAAKLERLSRGEATERVESNIAGDINVHSVNLSAISDEELVKLDEIVGRIFSG